MRFETCRHDLGEGVVYAIVETPTKTVLILNTNANAVLPDAEQDTG